jgi:hypothetical protein
VGTMMSSVVYIIILWALLCSAVIAPVMSKRVLSKEVLAQKRATRPSGVTKSIVSATQQVNRSGFRFLNVPHINNRPLKISLSYAK